VARCAAVPLLAFLALATWALSSPVGSSPDEDYHLISTWCGQGLEEGTCEEGASSDQRRVPESLANSSACYAFHSETSARCQDEWFVQESDALVATDRGNFTGTYPPAFYATMHVLVGDDISRSVIAMRLANAGLFVGLLTVVFRLLPPGRRTMLALGPAAALVPLGVFIVPSVNPSSWAVTACAAVFPALVGFFETTGRRRLALGGVAVLAALLAAGSRADAAVFVALAAVMATVVGAPWRRDVGKLLVLPALIAGVCLVSYLVSGQSEAVSTGLAGSEDTTVSTAFVLMHNLLNVPALWVGAFGYWGLGWLDTPMPSVVWVFNVAAFAAVVWLGMRHASSRKAVAIALGVVAAWGVPTLVLVQSATVVGFQVQPRYLLPLLVLLAQVALFRVGPLRPRLSRAQLVTVAGVLAVTNAVALHFNTRRYVTGTDVFHVDLDLRAEWWWAIPLSPMTLWVLGAVSFAVAILLCVTALEPAVEGRVGRDVPEEGAVPLPAEATDGPEATSAALPSPGRSHPATVGASPAVAARAPVEAGAPSRG